MSESYSTGGVKNFSHGIVYQLKWLMLFLKRAVDKGYSFRLATEMKSVAGFDDIVFQYEQNGTTVHRFVQIKHKQDVTEKISVGSLLTKSSEFNLLKYFVAYLKIKSNGEFEGEVKDFIIATNIDFDSTDSILHPVRELRVMLSGENKGKEISVKKIETQDDFFYIGNSARYRINDSYGSIPQYLGQHMDFIKREIGREVSNEEIEGFSNELVFAVNQPNENQLEELIKDEISNELARKFKYFGDNEFTYHAFFMMVLGWMKDREGRFLSPKEGREFFQKVELWASTVSEIRQGVERIEGKVDEIGEGVEILVNNQQQARKEPICFNMKYPVKTFTGRKGKLKEIYNGLQKSTQAEVSHTIVIGGLGGIGKSELARRYAYEYRKDYDGNVIWINAETQKDLEESFKGLARELNRRLPEDSKISTTEGVKSVIEDVYRYFEDVKGLFVFDNAEGYKNISKFLPSSLNYRPDVLITSRDTKWEVGQKVEIEVIKLDILARSEALEFVEKLLDIDNISQDKEIKKLTKELQYFPLALEQAVAYIHNKNKESKYGRFKISDYLKEYRQEAEKLFKETEKLLAGEEECESGVCYTKTIFTTWDVTIEAIKQKGSGIEALSILEIMAYLPPDGICIKEIFAKLIEDDKKKFLNAVKLFDRYSMINLREEIVNIHRLVQKVIRLKLQEKGQEEETLRKALKLINSNNIEREDISHIVSVWEYASQHGKLIDEFYFNSTYVCKVRFSTKNKKSNPLQLLVKSGSCKAIMAILTHVEKHHLDKFGEVISIKDNCGQTPLHIAAFSRKLDVVECLISKGADFGAKDKINSTPLHFAAEGGDYEVVKAVLTHIEKEHSSGISKVVNAKTNNGAAPLHLAACSGNLNVVEHLINKGANVDAKGRSGLTSLFYAVQSGNLKIVKYLVNKGAYINARNKDVETPLHYAVRSENLEVMEYLIEKGANVNAKDNGGYTPLYLAALLKKVGAAKVLLKHNADVNARNNWGETALHCVTDSNHPEFVKLLLTHNAKVYSKVFK